MANKLKVAMVGTFDVANYRDLLFPIISEAELRRRWHQPVGRKGVY